MTDTPLQWSVEEFLDRLASSQPTPGGGSVSALTGALAAGLVVMVCQLTVGRKRYAEVEEEIRSVLERAEQARGRLQELVAQDIAAYGALSAAYRLPKETEEQRQAREQAIQEALVGATETPLEVAEQARRVAELAQVVARQGNRLAVSDAGIAGVLAEAAAQAAAFNVWINLAVSQDTVFQSSCEMRLREALAQASTLRQEVMATTQERMG